MPDPLPYTTLSAWFKRRHGTRVYKVPLNPGLGCPNRDGTISTAGCLFCDEFESGHPGARINRQPIRAQFDRQVKTRRAVDPRGCRFLPYLQAGTGTHGDPDVLRALYEEVRELPGAVGVSIGTRPDCVPERTLELIAEVFDGREVWIELGVQSMHDETLSRIGRNHTVADFADAVARCRSRGFFTCAHVILGLPGETPETAVETAERLAGVGIDGLKLHPLYVARGSGLEAAWRAGKFVPPDEDTYAERVVDFLERTPASVVIHRLSGRGRKEVHLAPDWVQKPSETRRKVLAVFAARRSRQGDRIGG